ncbi:mechanosensitive ion channel [Hyphomonas sp. FCG-A18]|uniref:mechanosensitive ion channel family protein n=1 Tax=Hyphomonas sp. FCG-A18 TaxID=3080019 RepID=UPI002B2A4C8F|nr:mechanosensitive ion channel [Hyphomonas sp. FCG-A18]
MSLQGIGKLWSWLIGSSQAEDDPVPVEGAEEPAELEGGLDLEAPVDVPIEVVPEEVEAAPRTSDPIEALTETTERATEAATEFVGWVGSGEREALIALALVIGFTALQWALKWAILKGIVRLPRNDDYSVAALFQRVVKRFHIYFMIALALTATDSILSLPGAVSGFVRIYFVLALVIQIAEWVQEFAVSAIKRSVHRGGGDAKALASAFNIIKYFIMLGVWTIALLLIMSNVGMDVTALLAGLGIGGIAIGIAAQGVFRDLFSSLSIVIDKPFQVGDTVRYGESWGTIEDIGLKTTRVRARSGEQLIISNTNLLDYEIHNMTRMARRRIETEFGVIYQTDPDVADRIPGIVAEMFKDLQGVDFDRCGMSSFGPSSLDYSLVFFSLNPEFNRSMAARSRVLLALYRTFKEQGIEFAYPTQTLYIEGFKKD